MNRSLSQLTLNGRSTRLSFVDFGQMWLFDLSLLLPDRELRTMPKPYRLKQPHPPQLFCGIWWKQQQQLEQAWAGALLGTMAGLLVVRYPVGPFLFWKQKNVGRRNRLFGFLGLGDKTDILFRCFWPRRENRDLRESFFAAGSENGELKSIWVPPRLFSLSAVPA